MQAFCLNFLIFLIFIYFLYTFYKNEIFLFKYYVLYISIVLYDRILNILDYISTITAKPTIA